AAHPRGARGVPGGRWRRYRRPHDAGRRPGSRVAGRYRARVRSQRRHGLWLVSQRLLPRRDADRTTGGGWHRPRARIARRSVDDLADELVREATHGVGDTGIRPGIIGEIGTDKPWVSSLEERVHRAAARAARRTGLGLTTHSVLSPVGLEQLRIFEDEGADPSRVVVGHADSYPHLDHYLAIIERGAAIEFDFLGMSFTPAERHGEGRIVELLCELLSRGHVEHVLLSQDVCHDSQLQRYGGNGYTYLASAFLPRLRDAGVSEAEIE